MNWPSRYELGHRVRPSMYLLSHKASYLPFKRDQYHFTIQMLHICRPNMYYFSKLEFWSVLSLKMKLQKSILNLFQPISFFKSHIFIKFLATMRPQNFRNLSCKSMPTRFQEKIVSHQKLKEKKNNSGEITGDALLKMQMRLEKRLRPTTVSYLLIMPTINPPDVCH